MRLSLIFIKVTGWLAEFYKFLRTPFSQNTSRQLLLSLLLKKQIFEFSFFFSSFPDVYLLIIVTLANVFILFIKWLRLYNYTLTLTKFVLICLLIEVVATWLSPGKREEKLENSSEFYILGLGKTLINCILIKFSFKISYTTKSKFSLTILQ